MRLLPTLPIGYVDSYGLYEAFGGNPYSIIDPMGLEDQLVLPIGIKQLKGRFDDIDVKELIEIANTTIFSQADVRLEIIGKVTKFTQKQTKNILSKNKIFFSFGEGELEQITKDIEEAGYTLEEVEKMGAYIFSRNEQGEIIGELRISRRSQLLKKEDRYWNTKIYSGIKEIYDMHYKDKYSSYKNSPFLLIFDSGNVGGGQSFGVTYYDRYDKITEEIRKIADKNYEDFINGAAVISRRPWSSALTRSKEKDRLGRTIAHEIIHVLLNSGAHHSEAINIMSTGLGAKLNSEQILVIRKYVQNRYTNKNP